MPQDRKRVDHLVPRHHTPRKILIWEFYQPNPQLIKDPVKVNMIIPGSLVGGLGTPGNRTPNCNLTFRSRSSQLYSGFIGIMEKKMETTGIIGVIWGYVLGLYRDNGRENGNYYTGFEMRFCRL